MICKFTYNYFLIVVLVFIAISSTGCQSGNQPVRSDVAIETLKSTLDHWKQGDDISVCSNDNPAIVVQDLDWMNGKRLNDYQIVAQKPKDANLFVTVELKLTENNSSTKTVVYCVGTDPVLTVFRTLDGKEM